MNRRLVLCRGVGCLFACVAALLRVGESRTAWAKPLMPRHRSSVEQKRDEQPRDALNPPDAMPTPRPREAEEGHRVQQLVIALPTAPSLPPNGRHRPWFAGSAIGMRLGVLSALGGRNHLGTTGVMAEWFTESQSALTVEYDLALGTASDARLPLVLHRAGVGIRRPLLAKRFAGRLPNPQLRLFVDGQVGTSANVMVTATHRRVAAMGEVGVRAGYELSVGHTGLRNERLDAARSRFRVAIDTRMLLTETAIGWLFALELGWTL